MPTLLHLDGRPQTWAELHERNRAYWATHDREGKMAMYPSDLAEAKAALAFILDWALEDAEWEPEADDDWPKMPVTPDHDCGFVTRPDTGYCEFHDGFWRAWFIANPHTR